MDEYTHVVLWDKDEEGRIRILAQAPVPSPWVRYYPNVYFVYMPPDAYPYCRGNPQSYANQLAHGFSEDFTAEAYLRSLEQS